VIALVLKFGFPLEVEVVHIAIN